MKRLICICLTVLLSFSVCGCAELTKGVETDYAAAIMAEGEIYLKAASPMPAEVDPSAIIGYTDSYTDTFPKKDGETNFNRELDMPYARVEGGIAVLYENEWYLCTPMDRNAKEPVESNKVYGTAVFYDGPVKEAQASERSIMVGRSIELTREQADKLKAVVDNVDEWTDDNMVDRLAYWFDGHFEFADREFEYYFTYQHNVIYYDHYFAEISEEDMRFIMELNPGGSEKLSEGSGEDVPLYVISDGKCVAPRMEFAYSREWTEHGWLYADGVDWSMDLPQMYMELPVVSLTEDFAVEYGKGVDFYNVSVYDAEFEQLYNNMDFSCLNELSDGDYYIGICVNIDGKYIESEGESEYTGRVGIYKLEKYGADHVELSGSASKKPTAASDLTPSADGNDQPPNLRVSGGSETITALRGTSSWYYLNMYGTSTGIESDSVHPLEAKQYMPGLNMVEGRAEFFFDTMPDEITAECWDISEWGNPEAESQTVSVDTVYLEILPGGHIYEITAKWDCPEYGGTARYSFYTSPLGIELTTKDISSTGLTLVCTQSGGKPDGGLMTGASFRLQTYNEELGFWEDIPTKNELIFTSEAWQIPMNSSVEWKTDWELYYGELLSGRYRIFKEIMDFRGTGDFDLYNYYAEFTID